MFNHVAYADNIFLLAPSALGLQKHLDVLVCHRFSQCNDIVIKPLKSVYFVFRPK